ncbi:MAG: hypothetical protein H6597_07945 [Flavobacteriales bacterium]|nr:hypothetical protein [Flavobacteriales bacterium]MCB9194447.1 hypothetical protein [Flavobacteriales bacterium]
MRTFIIIMVHDAHAPRDRTIARTAWALYTLVVAIGVARGGMWLDEMQVWCLARDHHSVHDLLHALRNEGHPPLWPLLVHGLTLLTHRPLVMGVLHGLFAVVTAWIILFRAPWPILFRVLAVFGYFVLFEYAVIARNYGPGMCFLFIALLAHDTERPWTTMLALMALAMTHYWGIVVAGAWAITGTFQRGIDRAERARLITVLAVATCAFILAWPGDHLPYTPDVHRLSIATLPDEIGRMLGQLFLPFPDLARPRPWNTTWLHNTYTHVNEVLGYFCLGLAIACIRTEGRWLVFFLLVALGTLAFPVLAPFQGLRYYGPILLGLLAVLWMRPASLHGIRRIVILALVALQVPGALAMTWIGLRTPRSTAEQVVDWYLGSRYKGLPIMVHPYQAAPAISGYLDRSVFCPATGSLVSYYDWTRPRYRLQPQDLAQVLRRSPYERYLLVADNAGLQGYNDDGLSITQVRTAAHALISSEELRVYLITRPR